MRDRFRRLTGGARAVESRLGAGFEKAAQAVLGPSTYSALEIVDQASEEIARHVHPIGRGRYGFPFNDVRITFAAPTSEARARLDAICAGPPTLGERVLQRISSAGCEAVDVEVSVSFVTAPDPAWARAEFDTALARIDRPARAFQEPSICIELVVMHGSADRGAYSFTALPIAIGRGAEVRDSRHQLIRINHVAFAEGGDAAAQGVSRRHAHIELDQATSRPRLIDDNSAHGTSVIRQARGIAVPRGSRGLSLQSGDEIVLGQARLRVRIGAAPAGS